MSSRSGRYRGTELQRVEAQHRTAVGRLVMLHRWMSADDKRWLLERFPELEAPLAHLDRCDNQIALSTVGTGTEDRGLGINLTLKTRDSGEVPDPASVTW